MKSSTGSPFCRLWLKTLSLVKNSQQIKNTGSTAIRCSTWLVLTTPLRKWWFYKLGGKRQRLYCIWLEPCEETADKPEHNSIDSDYLDRGLKLHAGSANLRQFTWNSTYNRNATCFDTWWMSTVVLTSQAFHIHYTWIVRIIMLMLLNIIIFFIYCTITKLYKPHPIQHLMCIVTWPVYIASCHGLTTSATCSLWSLMSVTQSKCSDDKWKWSILSKLAVSVQGNRNGSSVWVRPPHQCGKTTKQQLYC